MTPSNEQLVMVAVIKQHTMRLRLLEKARRLAIFRALRSGVRPVDIAAAAGVSKARISQMKHEAAAFDEAAAIEELKRENFIGDL